jgi:hypothetical protein
MRRDFNGQLASEFDGSHISKQARADLKKLGPEKATRIKIVADRPKIMPPEKWNDHLARIARLRP